MYTPKAGSNFPQQQNTTSNFSLGIATNVMFSVNEQERRVQELVKQQRAEHAQNGNCNASLLDTAVISPTQRRIFEKMAAEQLQRDEQNRPLSVASTFDLHSTVLEFQVYNHNHQFMQFPDPKNIVMESDFMTEEQRRAVDIYLSPEVLDESK